MFKNKSSVDIRKLEKKFIDYKKAPIDRFKYLKALVGGCTYV